MCLLLPLRDIKATNMECCLKINIETKSDKLDILHHLTFLTNKCQCSSKTLNIPKADVPSSAELCPCLSRPGSLRFPFVLTCVWCKWRIIAESLYGNIFFFFQKKITEKEWLFDTRTKKDKAVGFGEVPERAYRHKNKWRLRRPPSRLKIKLILLALCSFSSPSTVIKICLPS